MIDRLVRVLQMLAAPLEGQFSRVSGFTPPVDALADDYADALLLVTDCPQIRLTPEQQAALEGVDDALASLQARGDGARQTDSADREAVAWQAVRTRARAALRALADGPHD